MNIVKRIVVIILLIQISSLSLCAQKRQFKVVFETDFNNDKAIVNYKGDTLLNKNITTDHRIGNAELLNVTDYEHAFFIVQVNKQKKTVSISDTKFFAVRYLNNKIVIVRYKKQPVYD